LPKLHHHLHQGGKMIRTIAGFFFIPSICAVLLSVSVAPVIAKDLQLNEDHLFEYAGYLYKSGEYYRAISEYKRLQYFFPDSSLSDLSILQIGRSYMAGDRVDEAIDYWQPYISNSDLHNTTFDRLKILLGISLLDADKEEPFSLRADNISSAFSYFRDLNTEDREARLIVDFSNDWISRPSVEKKSPWIAGTLSAILPGAGSLYTGRYVEGTYAFFITGLFLYATMEAQNNEQSGLAALFGFFSVGFYGGSIYAAINGVYKQNDKKEADQLTRLREKHGIWFIPETFENEGRF